MITNINQVSFVSFQGDPEKQDSNHTTSPIDWNVTLQVLNGWYDKMVTASREPDWQQRQTQFQAIDHEIRQLRTDVTKSQKMLESISTQGSRKAIGEAMGNILVVTLLPHTSLSRQREDRISGRAGTLREGGRWRIQSRKTDILDIAVFVLKPSEMLGSTA